MPFHGKRGFIYESSMYVVSPTTVSRMSTVFTGPLRVSSSTSPSFWRTRSLCSEDRKSMKQSQNGSGGGGNGCDSKGFVEGNCCVYHQRKSRPCFITSTSPTVHCQTLGGMEDEGVCENIRGAERTFANVLEKTLFLCVAGNVQHSSFFYF